MKPRMATIALRNFDEFFYSIFSYLFQPQSPFFHLIFSDLHFRKSQIYILILPMWHWLFQIRRCFYWPLIFPYQLLFRALYRGDYTAVASIPNPTSCPLPRSSTHFTHLHYFYGKTAILSNDSAPHRGRATGAQKKPRGVCVILWCFLANQCVFLAPFSQFSRTASSPKAL